MPKITNIVIKGTIALVLVILIVGYISYSVSQKSPAGTPGQQSPADANTNSSEQQNLPANAVKPEPVKIRYVSGIIKEVAKDSIVVETVTPTGNQETVVNFNSTTKILKGEGTGKEVAAADLAKDWYVAVFLPEDKNNNIAQIIQVISQKAL